MPPRKTPFYKRLRLSSLISSPICSLAQKLLRKAEASERCRSSAVSSLNGLLDLHTELWQGLTDIPGPGYAELGRTQAPSAACMRSDAVIITARFRTGSTMLWNLFRNVQGCTAYYEPMSPSRYFDPANRVERVDPTHHGVQEYWAEYEGLSELARLYRVDWHHRNLLMGPDSWNPDLKRFIEVMIEKAKGRPVLQCNRIDFRLPWVRRHFPKARLIHLYRHPRDQWCSTVQDNQSRSKARMTGQATRPERFDFGKDSTWQQFAEHDYYYLTIWGNDLRHHFPFLDQQRLRHPYQLFYFIWKLSYLFGRKYADYSVEYEALLANPEPQLRQLMGAAGVLEFDLAQLRSLLSAPALGKWMSYADDAWFREHEEYCETVLDDFLGSPPAIRDERQRTAAKPSNGQLVGR
ncbi:MAG: sulfotransferase [Planctomycetia bacterium]|nr:sulfotransferase [Planctomycetia bacterium]